jgi:uncharacterized protein (DUF302 family)
MATTHEESHTITRITRFIPKPFNDVLAKLQSSIKKPTEDPGLSILNHMDSKESFEAATNAGLGPHGFMQFAQWNHGSWMHLYGVHEGKQSTRIVFGNPQIAITMLKHDVTAGLFAPVEALVVERADGKGTDVIQIKPSTLVAGREGVTKELRDAAEVLDAKLEKLWAFVASD